MNHTFHIFYLKIVNLKKNTTVKIASQYVAWCVCLFFVCVFFYIGNGLVCCVFVRFCLFYVCFVAVILVLKGTIL